MADALAPTFTEDGLPVLWRLSERRTRKLGCSNIFAGVNLHQLHKLFRAAGQRDAEHWAKLAWKGTDGETGRAEEEREGEKGEAMEKEAGLARALVGLRGRARNRAGVRAEGHRDPAWLRAFGHLRIKERGPSPGHTAEEGEEGGDREDPRRCESLLLSSAGVSSGRLGVARQEEARDPERYFHHVLH